MNNPPTTLSSEDMELVRDFFDKKEITDVCPYCHARSVVILKSLVALTINTTGSGAFPFVALFCNNCYHIAFFAATPIIGGGDIFDFPTKKDHQN